MADNQLSVGTILSSSYRIDRYLGSGGFGITYLGYDLNMRKKITIKEFFLSEHTIRLTDQSLIGKPGYEQLYNQEKARFVEEARILASLDDLPGVVNVHHYFEENNTAYFVMEYIEGQTLLDYWKEHGCKLEVSSLLDMLKPVVATLSVMHDKGIVHKDISPDNILIKSSGEVKLIDFGAARDKESSGEELRNYKKSYSPPEQTDVTSKTGSYSDVYALCATIYMLITGVRPQSAIERLKNDTIVSPKDMGVDINPLLSAAIMNGLTLDIDERISNASDLYYFFYMYGTKNAASATDMKDKIRKSQTSVMLERMKQERELEKKRKIIIAVIAILVIIFLILTAVRVVTEKVVYRKYLDEYQIESDHPADEVL